MSATPRPLRIVADENMPGLQALFSGLGEVTALPGRDLDPEIVKDADVLLVRSVTKVNEALLADSKVRFVGSATIGMDHLDRPWLDSRNIFHTNAPGCNAESVADYVIGVLAHLFLVDGYDGFHDKRFAVIGAGNVGSRVVKRLRGMGLNVVVNDPPLEKSGTQPEESFVCLEDALKADIICMHTPLVRGGDHPTKHLIGKDELSKIRPGSLLINAGRGDVIDNSALLARLEQQHDFTVALDVWEGEPDVLRALIPFTRLSTPHIAGYSLDGRMRGSWMIYQSLCHFLGMTPDIELESLLPSPFISEARVQGDTSFADCLRLVPLTVDVHRESERFRQHYADSNEHPGLFDRLRKSYPLAREMSTLKIALDNATSATQHTLSALGFSLKDV
ncbi:4-phosphoerythronate dehydrogenase [Pokkaliibacter sp. CJK22405]|uniref:4-phosphoerythronate dehydrogenase n=1 Tax=Pokkaliibacter sp. CJK22405 TaxID=3384615 RepID=UPI0039852FBB